MDLFSPNGGSRTSLVLYALSFGVFTALHFIAPAVSAPFALSSDSAPADWAVVASVVAFFWSIWTSMAFQRSRGSLGPWRLLRINFLPLSTAFIVTSGLLIWSTVSMNLELPPDSPLMDNRNLSVIVAYCRLPILSHVVAMYVLSAAVVYWLVKSPQDARRTLLYGGLSVLVYYFLLVKLNEMFVGEIEEMIMYPNQSRYFALFLFWIPTVVASLAAVVAYRAAFARK